jgi:glycerol-3-phosphate O-acyltransferase 1/2
LNLCFFFQQEEVSQDVERARRIAHHMEDTSSEEDDEYHTSSKKYEDDKSTPRVYLPTDTHCERLVLMSALAPFSHTYLAVAFTLNHLIGCQTMVENEFVKLCVKEIKHRVVNCECRYGESVSTDSVRNCVKIMQKNSIVDLTNNHGIRLIALNSVYDSAMGVENVIKKFEKFVPF